MTDLFEQIYAADMASKAYGAVSVPGKSLLPDFIEVIGNWRITKDSQVIVKRTIEESTSDSIPFFIPSGKDNGITGYLNRKIFPYPIWAFEDRTALISIIEGSEVATGVVSANPSASLLNWCYAFEILLKKGEGNVYTGTGAFTCPYNKNFLQTPYYDYTNALKYPLLITGDAYYIHFNATLSYSQPESFLTIGLKYYTNPTLTSGGVDMTLLNLTLDTPTVNSISLLSSSTPIDSSIVSSVGINGKQDLSKATYNSETTSDIQILSDKYIISKGIDYKMDKLGRRIIGKNDARKKFIDEYMFDYNDYKNNYILKEA